MGNLGLRDSGENRKPKRYSYRFPQSPKTRVPKGPFRPKRFEAQTSKPQTTHRNLTPNRSPEVPACSFQMRCIAENKHFPQTTCGAYGLQSFLSAAALSRRKALETTCFRSKRDLGRFRAAKFRVRGVGFGELQALSLKHPKQMNTATEEMISAIVRSL